MLPAVKKLLRSGAAGLTFIDLLVTITVMAIVTLPLLHLFMANCAAIVRAGHKTAAVNLCREKIEVIKSRGYNYYLDSINGSPGGVYMEIEEPPGDEDPYRRKTRLQLVELSLESEEAVIHVIAINVQVMWQELKTEHAVEMESYLTRR